MEKSLHAQFDGIDKREMQMDTPTKNENIFSEDNWLDNITVKGVEFENRIKTKMTKWIIVIRFACAHWILNDWSVNTKTKTTHNGNQWKWRLDA